MKSSIVNIESVSNNSFGTGFVIDNNEKGVYVLTCQHVLDDVKIPVVENVLAKVIAKDEFIDMAVLYVSKLQLEALPLQTTPCEQLDVDVIGFSVFNKTLTQKKHINATLYEESIELHSKEDENYYTIRKIKAKDGFTFDRGNSGSPVICKNTGNVIAIISNKEGSDIGYAIDIATLKTVWVDVPEKLFLNTVKPITEEVKTQETIEKVSGLNREVPKIIERVTHKKKSSFLRDLLLSILMIVLGSGSYILYEKNQQEEAAKLEKKENERKAKVLKKTLQYEEKGFKYILKKDYNQAILSFQEAEKLTPSFHSVNEIASLLNAHKNTMNLSTTNISVLSEIINKYAEHAPQNFITSIQDQIKPKPIPPRPKHPPKRKEEIDPK